MPVRKVTVSLPAINETSSGFSPKSGFPVIKFSISAQEGFLETRSLRLVGRYQVKSDSTTLVDPTQVNFDNIDKNADDVGNIQPCTAATFSPFGGIKTAIDKVVIMSKKVSKELSSDVNYSQYVALREPRFGEKSDFRNSPPSRSFSLGQNAKESQRRFNVSASGGGIQAKDQGQEFSMKLDIPMFQNQPLALDEAHLGGLMISIHLSPESSFFSSYMNGTATPPAGANAIDTYRYVLQDLRLEARVQIPTAADVKAYNPVFTMDNQINLIQDVHSSSSSNTLSPQVSMVKGIVNLFLQQSQTNNLSQSQFSYSMPPGLRSEIQAKNGVRYPLKFPVQSSPNYADSTSVAVANLVYPSLQTNVSEARLQFERALNDGKVPEYTSATMVLTEESEVNRGLAVTAPTTSTNLAVDSVGIGSDYTLGIGLAQDYRGQDYNLVLESGVNTTNEKLLPTFSSNPLLQQTFVRNVAYFDSRSLQKTM